MVKNDPKDRIDAFGLFGMIPPPPGGGTHFAPPTTPPPPKFDCSGYSKLVGQTCISCGGFGSKTKDVYPEKAKTVCEGFAKLYTDSVMQGPTACVAQCLINAESECQKYSNCSDRNCCRLLAHVQCYASCAFIPHKGLPPGGAEVGWNDLFPSASLSPKCISIGQAAIKAVFPTLATP